MPIAALLASVASAGCANHPDQLARAESHFLSNRYHMALSNLEDLEIHRPTLSVSERVRYDVVRGMAHLRLHQSRDARYWLSLAREEAAAEPTALTQAMRSEIERVMVQTDPLSESESSGASSVVTNDGNASR
jgi:hypothetical protein